MGLFGKRKEKDLAAIAAGRAKISSADVEQVRFLLTTSKNLMAVKIIRDRTGLDLADAKAVVDEIRYGTFVLPATLPATRPVDRAAGQGPTLADRVRALKANGDLHQATALVVAETGMTDAEAGLFVGALHTR
ncbi:hypothetical protein [Kribbella deserti]|uniref:50S ribosomal protein L7/L12 n=1 Tax=Kribbella deserti TaxID=1926257 RepID=A0ABV6QW15_9ACTN